MKVLGIGGIGIGWGEIEILIGDGSAPSIKFCRQALNRAVELNSKRDSVSLSDSKQQVVAVATGI
jgi:phosphopantetheinyl transferase (holo-ACP synthase)